MQKWEYLRVIITYAGVSLNLDKVYSNGIEVFDARGKDKNQKFKVSEYFTKLGSDGWELVSSTEIGGYSETHHFKRPIE
jgi:hypothetical protein